MNSVHSVTEPRKDESLIKKLVWQLMPLMALAAATMAHCATERDMQVSVEPQPSVQEAVASSLRAVSSYLPSLH